MQSSPRIGVIGSGAIGGYYGALLAHAGFDVHFLLRSEYEAVARQGLYVRSLLRGDIRLEKVNAHREADAMPRCDVLLIGTKATSNTGLAPLITKVAAPDAKVLVLQNGLNVEEQLRRMLPPGLHVLGGLCWVGVHRQSEGVIDHIALGNVDVGYHSGPATDSGLKQRIVDSINELFAASGTRAKATPNLEKSRWRKLVWNIPYNGLSVLLDSGTQGMMSNPDSRQLIREIMREVIDAAAICGHDLPPETIDEMLDLTGSIADYLPSMYHDHVHRRAMELDVMYGLPLDAVRSAGGSMPKVEVLYRALRFLEARNLSAG
jgi:2-dehydropantoate 2-reductase